MRIIARKPTNWIGADGYTTRKILREENNGCLKCVISKVGFHSAIAKKVCSIQYW